MSTIAHQFKTDHLHGVWPAIPLPWRDDDTAAVGSAKQLPHGYGGYFTGVYHSTGGLWLYAHQGYGTVTGTMVMRDVAMIDTNYDDGKPGSGSVVEHSYGRTGGGYNAATPGTYNNWADGAQMDQAIANTWYAAQ